VATDLQGSYNLAQHTVPRTIALTRPWGRRGHVVS